MMKSFQVLGGYQLHAVSTELEVKLHRRRLPSLPVLLMVRDGLGCLLQRALRFRGSLGDSRPIRSHQGRHLLPRRAVLDC